MLLEGVDLLTLAAGRLRARARQARRDDLPGPALVAPPALQDRLADRRGDPGARARLRRRRRARARSRRSAEVGIPNAADRLSSYPHELSGGMRQRVMIAMALVLDPEILIADEPTTALDVTVQAQILDLVRELQAEHGTAVVLITHDLGVIAETADEVAVMYAGRVAELGPLTGVLDHRSTRTRGGFSSRCRAHGVSLGAAPPDRRRRRRASSPSRAAARSTRAARTHSPSARTRSRGCRRRRRARGRLPPSRRDPARDRDEDPLRQGARV